jgi:ATP-dependent DNA helicase DinG
VPSAADLLAPDGPIAAALRREGFEFEPRPQQGAMAAAVERAMAGGAAGRLIVEAGTGVGKSFAYLVPAILRCVLHGERVVVATNTIALQEQLVSRDIPLLQSVLDQWCPGVGRVDDGDPRTCHPARRPAPLHPVLVKGRGNYLSLRRLKMASQRSLTLFPDERSRRDLHALEDWAVSTLDGSLATAPPLERAAVWDRVQSDAGNCMGRRCPTYNACFYQNARREMDRGNLLVTNHALFFSDLAIRARAGEEAGVLPRYDHVVLDEAHNAEDAASEHFGLSLSESRVAHLLNLLYHPRTGRGFLASPTLRAAGAPAVDAAHHAVLAAHDASREFFESLALVLRRSGGSPAGRLHREHAATIENSLSPAMQSLVLRLKALRDALGGDLDLASAEAGRSRQREEDRYELTSYILRATAIADEAGTLVAQSLPGYVYWIEASDADADARPAREKPLVQPRVRLACSPIEVAPVLREHLFARPHSIVLTSATLTTATPGPRRAGADGFIHEPVPSERAGRDESPGGSPASAPLADHAFAHIASTLGCDRAATLRLDSPFDFARQVRLIVDTSVPDPRATAGRPARVARSARAEEWPPPADDVPGARSRGDYIDALAERILHHARATDGGAFVLFTSFADLHAVADRIEVALARSENPMPLLVQGRRASRSALLEAFRESGRAILLGAASFWQGVDVRGRALRNVIIVRLPFDPPDRPLTEARLERIRQRGGNPFMEESLPRAILRFKQGFGRLVRSRSDTGRVVVLDPRIVRTRYGQLFLDSLPAGVAPESADSPV